MVKTSNSWKTLFVCLVCGRESTTPDKECPTVERGALRGGGGNGTSCHAIEASINTRLEQDPRYDRERLLRADFQLQGNGGCVECLGAGCHVCVVGAPSAFQLADTPMPPPHPDPTEPDPTDTIEAFSKHLLGSKYG